MVFMEALGRNGRARRTAPAGREYQKYLYSDPPPMRTKPMTTSPSRRGTCRWRGRAAGGLGSVKGVVIEEDCPGLDFAPAVRHTSFGSRRNRSRAPVEGLPGSELQ